MLGVLFGHIGYFLVDDSRFLWPLSIVSGLGVDIFLFLSGFGLTVGMLNKPMRIFDFYRRRLIKVFIPFWIALIAFFTIDAWLLQRTYSVTYVLRSLFGLFPVADMPTDVNSVFWYITWILFYYLLFPIVFARQRPWLTALLLWVAGMLVVALHPDWFGPVIRLYEVHTLAFPLGVLAAWWLHGCAVRGQSLRVALRQQREIMPAPAYTAALIGLVIVFGYFATHSGVNQGAWKEQSLNILLLLSLTALFSLKKFDIGIFAFFGVYSYEIYLLHWPILSRYDLFFHSLSAWSAMFMYLVFFVALAWAMQKITAPVGAFFDSVDSPTKCDREPV